MSYKSYITCFAEFPTVLLHFWSGWVGVAGEVGIKTNLSPARASLLGLSLAIIAYVQLISQIMSIIFEDSEDF